MRRLWLGRTVVMVAAAAMVACGSSVPSGRVEVTPTASKVDQPFAIRFRGCNTISVCRCTVLGRRTKDALAGPRQLRGERKRRPRP